MIVKIWPIKADYAGDTTKVGGVKGLQNSINYIMNPQKVMVDRDNVYDMEISDEDVTNKYFPNNDKEWTTDEFRVLNYMANAEKIKGKYISGYLCDPEIALNEFNSARATVLKMAERTKEKEKGAVAFHLVQSFPEGLDISDEEVHQCGLELCQKLGDYQAVICSHVHPEIDEMSGEVHGKAKHNHILINAYIHPDKWDPKRPYQLKYHDSIENYALLRAWNDEIAIEHGLPIIRNPDNDRLYTWLESDEVNNGLSWKERIRFDIENARRATYSWDDFKAKMEANGYTIRDGVKNVSYTAPDGIHVARGKSLGREYTKESLELFWTARNYGFNAVSEAMKDNDAPPLLDIVTSTSEPLTVAVPIGNQNQSNRKYHYLPIERFEHPYESLATYFDIDELYDICDSSGRPIAAADGFEIIETIEKLRYGRSEKEKERAEEEMRRRREEEQNYNKKRYYTYRFFINTKTKKPYRTSLYDSNGRRRTNLELLFILAITVLTTEGSFWETKNIPPELKNDPIYAPRDWRIQNMLDAIYEAREAKIETPAQLDKRLKDVGAAHSRAKYALKNTKKAKEKMETLAGVVKDYRSVQELAERVLNMEDGPAKESARASYSDALEKYIQAKAVMYHFDIENEEQIRDFEERYEKITADIGELEEKYEIAKEEYRQINKLKYNTELAQNAQYCYGPTYTYDRAYFYEEERESDEARDKRAARTVDDLIGQSPNDIRDRKENDNEMEQGNK